MLYLDTSALLKLYIVEQGSEWVQGLLESQSEPLPVWEIQEMELYNALKLKVFRNELETSEAERQISLFSERKSRGLYYVPRINRAELMMHFKKLSNTTPETGCRTMDILHVACALQLKPAQFLSFDARQKALAKQQQLTVPEFTE